MYCQAGMVPALLCSDSCRQGRQQLCSQSCPGNPLTFGFTDHHVAELTFTSLIEALHLNVIRGLWLQVADGVPVPIS